MRIRPHAVAGRFYDSNASVCQRAIDEYAACPSEKTTQPVFGGVVPHAGWVCSGAVAGRVFAALAHVTVDTFVLFGTAHTVRTREAIVDEHDAWQTPLGQVAVDHEMRIAMCQQDPHLRLNADAHAQEHSLEVVVPFIQHLFPDARILPIVVPPFEQAMCVGNCAAPTASALGRKVVVLASTDLTHYGPQYRFTPKGIGPEAITWATQTNDARMIKLISEMDSDAILPEAQSNHNACGPGAIGATLLACRQLGATKGVTVCQTNSNEVLRHQYGDMDDDVGMVFV